jgi:parallel beta-helix repeat protein
MNRNALHVVLDINYIIKIIFLILSFILIEKNYAKNYYVDPSSAANTANGSLLNPWKNISQINNAMSGFDPGDTIFFKRGQRLSGTLYISNSGKTERPIVFTNYGVGNIPEISTGGAPVFLVRNARNIIIDGFKIADPSIDDPLHLIQARMKYGIILQNSPFCTIRNCEISKVGVGISVENGSDSTSIIKNFIHDLRMVRNTLTSINSNDDYGANPIVLGTSNNLISNNRFEECWARSHDYGFDGGAVELFGLSVNNNKIMYNTAINCNGFLEVGSQANGSAINNIIAYNKIINCGAIGVFQTAGSFKATIHNIQYYNNTVVETFKQYSKSSTLFWMSGSGKPGMVTVRNNIFWLSSGVNLVSNRFSSGQISHSNNYYRMSAGILGYTLGKAEFISSTTDIFKNTSDAPSKWNLELLPSSYPIDRGIDVGFKSDLVGQKIFNEPDLGCLEYVEKRELEPLVATVSYSPIRCNGDSTEVMVLATGGAPPYYGVDTFKVKAGKYTFSVKDQFGDSSNVSIEIPDPKPISIFYQVNQMNSQVKESILKVSIIGGVSPYVYRLNDKTPQTNGIFFDIPFGIHIITVIDSLGCSSKKQIILNETIVDNRVDIMSMASISPNPSNTSFLISIDRSVINTSYSIELYDLTGRILLSKNNLTEDRIFVGHHLRPGIYFISITTDKNFYVYRLFKS